MKHIMNILTVENVKKSYGLRVLFDDVTFAIDGGQKLGLIGFNGAGKTTRCASITCRRNRSSCRAIRSWKASSTATCRS